jgi:hypothetical protein
VKEARILQVAVAVKKVFLSWWGNRQGGGELQFFTSLFMTEY